MEEIKEIETIIKNLKKQYSLSKLVEAKNEKEERKRFLKSKRKREPKFEYELPIMPSRKYIDEIKSKIDELPSHLLPIYRDFPTILTYELEMIENIGKEEIREICSHIYGIPSHKTIKEAKRIVEAEVEKEEEPKIISSETLSNIFKDMLESYYKVKWKIELTDKYSTTVYPESQTISICKYRMFGLNEVKRLVNHEIKVHVLRTINGYKQKLRVLGLGLPYYLKTEEGLAVFMEKMTGVMDIYALKLRAARVLAVNRMLHSFNFVDVFSEMKELGFKDEVAWNITYRVFRGGGFTKDYIYLEGFFEIEKFIDKYNIKRLKDLFVGKIGLRDLKYLKKLINENIIHPPAYLPEELEEAED